MRKLKGSISMNWEIHEVEDAGIPDTVATRLYQVLWRLHAGDYSSILGLSGTYGSIWFHGARVVLFTHIRLLHLLDNDFSCDRLPQSCLLNLSTRSQNRKHDRT